MGYMVRLSPKSQQTNMKCFDQALKTQSQPLWVQGVLSTFFYHLPGKSQAQAARDTLWDPQGTEKHREIPVMFPKENFLWFLRAYGGYWGCPPLSTLGQGCVLLCFCLGMASMFSRLVSLQGSHDSPGTAVVCPSVRYPAC